mmetsp:Transcript_143601/g.459356  ORF Transcript_143601/g.459356 Transcript_143601/m.459356 type:complete len:221 (+) Transcript_143601:2190-2852(+)
MGMLHVSGIKPVPPPKSVAEGHPPDAAESKQALSGGAEAKSPKPASRFLVSAASPALRERRFRLLLRSPLLCSLLASSGGGDAPGGAEGKKGDGDCCAAEVVSCCCRRAAVRWATVERRSNSWKLQFSAACAAAACHLPSSDSQRALASAVCMSEGPWLRAATESSSINRSRDASSNASSPAAGVPTTDDTPDAPTYTCEAACAAAQTAAGAVPGRGTCR